MIGETALYMVVDGIPQRIAIVASRLAPDHHTFILVVAMVITDLIYEIIYFLILFHIEGIDKPFLFAMLLPDRDTAQPSVKVKESVKFLAIINGPGSGPSLTDPCQPKCNAD